MSKVSLPNMKQKIIVKILLITGIFLIVSCTQKDDFFNIDVQDQAVYDSLQKRIATFDDPSLALMEIQKVDSLPIFSKNSKLLLDWLYLKANKYYDNNQYTEALMLYEQVKQEAIDKSYVLMEAQCLERMASVHLSTDNPQLSLKYYYESLSLFEKINDPTGIAKVYNILAIYKGEYKDFKLAFQYINRALAINDSLHNHDLLIKNKGNVAYLYRLKGEYRQSAIHYEELIKELESSQEHLDLPMVYYSYAEVLDSLNRGTQAFDVIKKAVEIAEKTRDTSMLTYLYGDLGNRSNGTIAYAYWDKSLHCAQVIGNAQLQIPMLKKMAEWNFFHHQTSDGIQKLEQISILKDQVMEKKLQNHVFVSELKYNERKNMETLEMQKNQLKIRKSTILWILVVSILGFLITFLLLKNRRMQILNLNQLNQIKEKELLMQKDKLLQMEFKEENQLMQKKQQELEMQLKENELMRLTMQVSFIDEFLMDLNQIIASKSQNPKNLQPLLDQVYDKINQKQKELNYPELFNKKFNQIHPEFIKKLVNRFPNLTAHELKLSVYVKMHFSNKQIAVIMNVHPDTVNKSRYRLRKKFQLKNSESLEQFLEQIS